MSTSSEIRGILFGNEEHLVKLTELMDYLKIIMEDTEVKVGIAKRDLESQTQAILRIRQLLKEASNNRRDPYHNFLRQCLSRTQDMGLKLEYLMSKLWFTARCLRESNGDTFNCMGGLVHVGGVVRTGGRNGRRGVGEVQVTGGVTRGGGYNSGACGSGSVPSRIDPADGG